MSKALNGEDVNLFCSDTGLIQGQSILFFWVRVSLPISKTKISIKKRAVEAAKSNHLRSHHVEIHLQKIRL